jgi:hypothetical protein
MFALVCTATTVFGASSVLAETTKPVNHEGELIGPFNAEVNPSSQQLRVSMVAERMNSMPLAFTENMGQWDDRVKFRADAGGLAMWFTGDWVYYQFTRQIPKKGLWSDDPAQTQRNGGQTSAFTPSDRFERELDILEQLVVRASFIGANREPVVRGEAMVEHKCNYFLGNDRSKWRTDVPSYEAIVVEDVYQGIDLRYYGNGRQMEYDIVVSPGADYSEIRIRYEGVESLSIGDDGALVMTTEWGDMQESAPVAYQEIGGNRRPVAAEYVIQTDGSIGFRLDAQYDPTDGVTIDPVLKYSTYLCGKGWDKGFGIVVDDVGCAYITGRTNSPSIFPLGGPFGIYQSTYGGGANDAFVTKLDRYGSLIYSTYLGGSGADVASAITVDSDRCAYVAGFTASIDFPVWPLSNPYQSALLGDEDAFVTKLNSVGNSLEYSTYLGGNDLDRAYGIAVDGSDCAYVTGRTYSANFPTEQPCQPANSGVCDAFVTKFNSMGTDLVYSTYLGGNAIERPLGIALDGSDCAYVVGETGSYNYPTTIGAFQETKRSSDDAFVTKLSFSAGTLTLDYSTFLGGNGWDHGYAIAVDGNGCAYITGHTGSSVSQGFPITLGAFQNTHDGGWDAYVAKLNVYGSSVDYCTYLGGTGDDTGWGIAVDGMGCAYVTGQTFSADFDLERPWQSMLNGVADAFITKFMAQGNSLDYSTYFGGSNSERAWAIDVDAADCCVHITGETRSDDLPLQYEIQSVFWGYFDAFVTLLYDSKHCGDVNASGTVDIDDLIYLIFYIYAGGPAPEPCHSGDVDCSGAGLFEDVDIDDVVYLILYIFANGSAPCDPYPPPNGDGIPDC